MGYYKMPLLVQCLEKVSFCSFMVGLGGAVCAPRSWPVAFGVVVGVGVVNFVLSHSRFHSEPKSDGMPENKF